MVRPSSWHALGICRLWILAQLPAGRPVLAAGFDGVLRADPRDDLALPGGKDAFPQEERTGVAQSVLALLRCLCNCSVQKWRRGRGHGVVACCWHTFRESGLLQQIIDQRLQWQHLRKVDQGWLLFDTLRLLFNEQGTPTTQGGRQASPHNMPIPKHSYKVLGQPVCPRGFMPLWHVGGTHFRAHRSTVAGDHPSPQVDRSCSIPIRPV